MCYLKFSNKKNQVDWWKTLEIPLDSKEMTLVNPKGNQPWILIGRTDAKAEIPVLWPPDAKNWLTGKATDDGKDRRQEEKGTTEGEMFRWYHRLDGHEFQQTSGVGDGQWSLEWCSPWGHKELDTAEQLNWTQLMFIIEEAGNLNRRKFIFFDNFYSSFFWNDMFLFSQYHCSWLHWK